MGTRWCSRARAFRPRWPNGSRTASATWPAWPATPMASRIPRRCFRGSSPMSPSGRS
ncbi:hypothetical protein R2601_03538 [Salipiger bermudensis HTCC2601]|uniref:Uncharacterized protein n=1 Tax=Salipiger bermudensis (strain DSM 26914 / JCM 13377 / KCTC 12554 / HTCC2601) TaxID=314265 RepID=Q0FWD8_SALBH|nr:hypothetical protein R2601_03538 [Salipiger bermudensis HTCC2601]